MKKISILFCLLLSSTCLLISELEAQSRVGTTAAPFLTLGVGAKASALGHANTVMASGAEGLFWNPATIALNDDNGSTSGLYLAFNNIFMDVESQTAGLVLDLGSNRKFGFGLNYIDYGRMDVRTVEEPLGTGATFASHDLSVGVSYAQNLTPSFFFGGTAKFIQQKIYDMSAQTFAFDFGFVLKTEYLNGLSVGASISNFGGAMQMDGINSEFNLDIDPNSEGNNTQIPSRIYMDRWDIPISFRFGLALPAYTSKNLDLMLMSDVQQTNDNDMNIDSGAQLSYKTKTVQFHMRAGYRDFLLDDNVTAHFSYGAGLMLKTVNGPILGFDFAQVPFDYLGTSTMIDFRIHF